MIAEKKEPVKRNESFIIIKKVQERINENKGNDTKFELDLNDIYVLGGLSIGGIIILCGSFYIAWNCGLKEKVENMIIIFFIGEEGKSCLENITFFKEYFDYLKEIKEDEKDQKEYYGLTQEQIEVCKAAKAISKIKYEAALKVRWDEMAKRATRPDDPYHRSLFKRIIKDIPTKNDEPEFKKEIETMEQGLPLYEINPGTPRRRRNSVRI